MENNEGQETNQGSPESPCSKNKTSSTKEQDRFLPIANVGRIMKKVIPGNGKISKDAKETVQECVSEFISFITGEASDKCQREKRKTINGDDIIWAITTLGFEDYVNPLKAYLTKYRELEGEKINVIPSNNKQQRCDQLQPHLHPQQPSNSTNPFLDKSDDSAAVRNLLSRPVDLQQQQQGLLSPYGTSVYSSPNGLLLPQTSSFSGADQQFSLSFSPNSIPKSYQEQIDSVGHW